MAFYKTNVGGAEGISVPPVGYALSASKLSGRGNTWVGNKFETVTGSTNYLIPPTDQYAQEYAYRYITMNIADVLGEKVNIGCGNSSDWIAVAFKDNGEVTFIPYTIPSNNTYRFDINNNYADYQLLFIVSESAVYYARMYLS